MRIKSFSIRFGIILVIVIAALYVSILKTNLNETLAKPLTISEEPKKADIIVVLGSGVDKDTGSLPKKAQERVLTGIKLLRDGWAPSLLMSGGPVAGTSYIESTVMKQFALAHGVSDKEIFTEVHSTDTHGNALFTKESMPERHWQSAIVVTSDFHTKRACGVFRTQRVDITCVAADSTLVDQTSTRDKLDSFIAIAREYGATILYILLGYS